jgi:amino acid transporter
MEAATAGEPRRFDHLREHSIGLPQVLFQSITHMAPAAAVAYSIYISVPDAQQALPLSVALALIACICAATAIGQLAKLWPSAGGMYTYVARSLGPGGASSSPGCSSASSRSWPRFCTSSSVGR